jgi:hypothetical protein
VQRRELQPDERERLRETIQRAVTAVRQAMERLADEHPPEQRRWYINVNDSGWVREYQTQPAWRYYLGRPPFESTIAGLAEAQHLATVLESLPHLVLAIREGVCTTTGFGPASTPGEVSTQLIRVALAGPGREVIDDDIEAALDWLVDRYCHTDAILRVTALLNHVDWQSGPIAVDQELRIDRLSRRETAEFWSETPGGRAQGGTNRERMGIRPPVAIVGNVRARRSGEKPLSSDGYRALEEDIRERVLRLVHVLRLQAEDRVSVPFLWISNMTGGSSQMTLSPREEGPGAMVLKDRDSAEIARLFQAASRAPQHVRESLRWFGNSRERHREEDRIVDLATACEALFLPNDSNELSLRLSLRAAYFLQNQDAAEREKVFRHLRLAYDVRSAVVHGTSNWRKKLKGEVPSVFSDRTEELIRSALKRALLDGVPEDWDRLVLGLGLS